MNNILRTELNKIIGNNHKPTLHERLMMSTSLSSSALRERKTLREVMTIANPVLLGMLLIACGGGGGGGDSPAAGDNGGNGGGNEPDPIIVITPAGAGASPIASDGAGLLPEESAGDGAEGSSTAPIFLGTLSDDKDQSGNVTYTLDAGDFIIRLDDDGLYKLYYRGTGVNYENPDDPKSFTIQIERTDGDALHTLSYVVNVKDGADLPTPAPSGLHLHTTNTEYTTDGETRKVYSGGDSTIEKTDADGAITQTRNLNTLDYGVLTAETTSATPLGTFAKDGLEDGYLDTTKDGAGDGDDIFISYHYSLAANSEGNLFDNLFSINEDNQLLYIGAEITPSDIRPTFLMGIASRIKVTINLPDGSYYNLETDGRPTTDAGNINDHKFALNGGGFSDTNDVAEVGATASVDFGGLVLTAKSSTAADNGYRILIAQSAGVGDSNIAITLNGNLNLIIIQYGKDVNFDDLKGALDTDGDGVSDGDLAGLFDVTTDGTPTYDGTAKLSASAIDTSFVLAGGGASTKANAELESGVTIEAKGSGTGYDGIEIIGRYNSDLAAGEVRIDSVDATGTGKITIHYGKDATLAELIQAFITHYTTDYSGSNLGQLISQPASSSSTTLLGDIFGVYTGIITEDATIPGFRTIDVASGRIYVADTDGDGSNSKIIMFDAVDDLRIDATSFVIVDDTDGDGTYAVRTVATLPTSGDFYLLGAVDATQVPQMLATASLLKGDTTNGATFTADEAGAEGNDIKLVFAASGNATGGGVVATLTDKTITITYDGDATLADLAGYTLPDAVAALIELETVGAGDLSTILGTTTTSTTESLTGGLDAYKTQTITIGGDTASIDVTFTSTTGNEVVIKAYLVDISQSSPAIASIETENGVTTITVTHDSTGNNNPSATTQHIRDALNGLDADTLADNGLAEFSATLKSDGLTESEITDALALDAQLNFRPTPQMEGGAEAGADPVANPATFGSVTIEGLKITATSTGTVGNYKIIGSNTGVAGTTIPVFSVLGARILVDYQSDATLEDLKDFIDGIGSDGDSSNDVISATITDATAYGDGSTLLTDIFGVVEKATPEVVLTTGDAPTANPTATADNKFTAPTPTDTYQWETFGDLQPPEDFTILGPDIL